MTLIVSAILFAVALLAATHYATFSVAHRKGYDKASAEEVSLMEEDLKRYNALLHRVLNSVEDLLVLMENALFGTDAGPGWLEDERIYETEARQYDEAFTRRTTDEATLANEELNQTIAWFREHNLITEKEEEAHVTE